ncbi:transposase [Streptomyces tendae]|uniref:transposase n=1 Tax=Streptomyces tendae TaxID=1932 RepID=UPI003D762B7C
MADRLGLQGVLFVLCNDIAWQLLPVDLGFVSGQTCWRRLERWQKAGIFDRLHRVLLAKLNAAGELDWSRACVDGSHIRAKKGRLQRSVAGRPAENGRQHHLICDGRGTPLKVFTTAANVNGRHPDPRPGGKTIMGAVPSSPPSRRFKGTGLGVLFGGLTAVVSIWPSFIPA